MTANVLGVLPTSRKLVIADPSTCIGCKTCMAACLMCHNSPSDVAVPRLVLVTTRSISAPVGCHHCAEAPCVDACPVGCLYAAEDYVGVYPEKCIGCRNCVLACPYGAVEIVTRPLPPCPTEAAAWASADQGEDAPKPSARDRVRAKNKKRRTTASVVVKCDLCNTHAKGPACVSACPTKALRLIDARMIERSRQAKQKAAARGAAAYASLALNAHLDEKG